MIIISTSWRKATSLFEPYSLINLIDEPTHYTETFESIIDLLCTRNASSLLLYGVGDAFLYQNIRYHCLRHQGKVLLRTFWPTAAYFFFNL